VVHRTFDPLNHFSRVLMQQGVVQLDADWNEQGGGGRGIGIAKLPIANLRFDDFAILLEATPVDVLGVDATNGQVVVAACAVNGTPFAVGQYLVVRGDGPADSGAIDVTGRITRLALDTRTLTLEAVLTPLAMATNLRAHRLVTYKTQPGGVRESEQLVAGKQYQIYLDVWDQPITSLEDGSIREVARDGPDTAPRTHVAWQIRALENPPASRDGVPHRYTLVALATIEAGAAPTLVNAGPAYGIGSRTATP
jgi:uncharacterized protein DUF6519